MLVPEIELRGSVLETSTITCYVISLALNLIVCVCTRVRMCKWMQEQVSREVRNIQFPEAGVTGSCYEQLCSPRQMLGVKYRFSARTLCILHYRVRLWPPWFYFKVNVNFRSLIVLEVLSVRWTLTHVEEAHASRKLALCQKVEREATLYLSSRQTPFSFF